MTIPVANSDTQFDSTRREPLQRDATAEPQKINPVLLTAQYVLEQTDIVKLDEDGIRAAAQYVRGRLLAESYTPSSWRTHPLHMCPGESYAFQDVSESARACLDWIFFISSVNFSFWSEKASAQDRYGVEWRAGWNSQDRMVHTGYWALVAAVDRALEEGIPITDPAFYSLDSRCPDEVFRYVFRPAPGAKEQIPLLQERIAILRENGRILCKAYGGSFQGFHADFLRQTEERGAALDLVEKITDAFPSFRDEVMYNGRPAYFWKRAQICVAEAWAAFYPSSSSTPSVHPLFPQGAAIEQLTMFADYRVPQILHYLRILTYPPALVKQLKSTVMFATGSPEELSIRAASIVAVEKVKEEVLRLSDTLNEGCEGASSVLIDFYLWDLAKRLEKGEDRVDGIETEEILPAHRTRCVWY